MIGTNSKTQEQELLHCLVDEEAVERRSVELRSPESRPITAHAPRLAPRF